MKRSAAYACALLAAVGAASGCTQNLREAKIRSLAVQLDRPALCPGEEGQLEIRVDLEDGRTLWSEGAAQGKVGWDSFALAGNAVSVVEDGSVMANPDGIAYLTTTPSVTVRAVDHPDRTATLAIPIRYDCALTASFAGHRGKSGRQGVDETENPHHLDPTPGGNAGPGEPGADVVVHVALVKDALGREFLQVRAQEVGASRARYYLIAAQGAGSLTIDARGGHGGVGGKGGDSSHGNGEYGGSGGDGGDGGHVVLVLDDEAASYRNRFAIDVSGGHGGGAGRSGRDGSNPNVLNAAWDRVANGHGPKDGRDGKPGTATVKLEPVEPLW